MARISPGQQGKSSDGTDQGRPTMRPACTSDVSRSSAARGSTPMLRSQLSSGEIVRYGIVTHSKRKDQPGKGCQSCS